MTDKEEYKKTLALYLQTCQEEYRTTHKNCVTCELCKDREYAWPTCKITGREIGDFNWIRAIRAVMCKYYIPHIDETKQEEMSWIYERR